MAEVAGRLSIVICTYERPELLSAALRSIAELSDLAREDVEVVVVDNSDAGSARPVVEAAAAANVVPIRYVEAHPANISTARNAGIAVSTGDVVAFLDDDQELHPGWLRAVREALRCCPHDVLFGPIEPRFEDSASAGPEARAMFTRASDARLGADLRAFGRRSAQGFALSTANSIFRRANALRAPDPFDEAFGQCGGEDFHLLCRLQHAGGRFGWVPEARASDFVPRHRCDLAYLVRRHYAGGQAYAAAMVRSSPTPVRQAVQVAAQAGVQLVLSPIATLLAHLRFRPTTLPLSMRLAGAAGKMFWHGLYPLYRDEERRYARAATRS